MEQQGLCLNIGCGDRTAAGWMNIDASPYLRASTVPVLGRLALRLVGTENKLKNARYGDLVRGLKLDAGSCELIFASHVLEHLPIVDFDTAVGNMYGYLKPGGLLRVIVPDLQHCVDVYRRDLEDPSAAGDAASAFMTRSGVGGRRSRASLARRLHEALSNARHQWMWDQPSLSAALLRHGFQTVRACRYGEWGDSRFAAVEAEARHNNAICLEAMK